MLRTYTQEYVTVCIDTSHIDTHYKHIHKSMLQCILIRTYTQEYVTVYIDTSHIDTRHTHIHTTQRYRHEMYQRTL